MMSQAEVKVMEERNKKELKVIEDILYEKFKDIEDQDFCFKGTREYDEEERIDYEMMIEYLSETVQQYLWDEDLTLVDLEKIEEKQWDEWLLLYDMPEKCCDRCGGRGCNYCLMCGY